MPLSAAQLRHIEERLLDERARLMRELDDFIGTASTGARNCGNPVLLNARGQCADVYSGVREDDMDAALARQKSDELMQVQEALNRLADDPARFGLDELSGAEIPFTRLDSMPWARTTATAELR